MWYRIMLIKEWFGELTERHKLIRDFNKAGKNAFIVGEAPTLLEAKITKGDSTYRHHFSRFMGGGFRIKALSGKSLSRGEMQEIGTVVLGNQELVRRLISLGWDTLEVHDNAGYNGLKWQLMKHAGIGGLLQ